MFHINLSALFLVGLFLFAGCSTPSITDSWQQKQMANLSIALRQLNGPIHANEAEVFASTAVRRSAELSREYRATSPAWLHNFLVNGGLRQRGLCYDWANDLFPTLHNLNSPGLQLHLAVARLDTRREHNSVIVTARDQPFSTGIVLDAWRHSGRLWFGPVTRDKYPWKPLPPDRIPEGLRIYFQTDKKPPQ